LTPRCVLKTAGILWMPTEFTYAAESKQEKLRQASAEPQEGCDGHSPEHCDIAREETNCIPAKVDVSEIWAARVYLHVDVQGWMPCCGCR
jgi:hypothetical protein